jgi:hypothetical protein
MLSCGRSGGKHMSERGAEFLIDWVERNINPDDHPPAGDKALA